jgi:hypothetical protein
MGTFRLVSVVLMFDSSVCGGWTLTINGDVLENAKLLDSNLWVSTAPRGR